MDYSAKKRIFISFAYEDIGSVKGLRLMNSNTDFEIEFYDQSVKESINSANAAYIKSVIKDQIRRSSVTLCLVGTTTYKSAWVEWEVETSVESGNKIIAMAINGLDSVITPQVLKDYGIIVWKWDYEHLTRLINN